VKVSVIISNRNDAAMLCLTVRSVLEELKAVPGGGEIVIVDNSDRDIYEAISKGSFIASGYFREGVVRLFRQDYPCLFSAREEAVRQARGQYILCLDGHMLVGRNMIRDLVDFMNSRKGDSKVGFAHAPISWASHHESNARHSRAMSIGGDELGPWDKMYSTIHRMTWKGMPWICRRSFWLNDLGGYGALAKHKISWGGGDMHVGIKPWLLGFENWAVPTSPGIHIGPFPKQVTQHHKYRLYSKSGKYPASFGFLVSCYVLGGRLMVERNKKTIKERFGWKVDIDEHVEIAVKLGQEEKDWLDERKVMSFEELVKSKPWEED